MLKAAAHCDEAHLVQEIGHCLTLQLALSFSRPAVLELLAYAEEVGPVLHVADQQTLSAAPLVVELVSGLVVRALSLAMSCPILAYRACVLCWFLERPMKC